MFYNNIEACSSESGFKFSTITVQKLMLQFQEVGGIELLSHSTMCIFLSFILLLQSSPRIVPPLGLPKHGSVGGLTLWRVNLCSAGYEKVGPVRELTVHRRCHYERA